MQVTGNNKKISVQVSLNGFSFSTYGCARSGWLSADRVFTTPEFQKRYDEVEISVFTPKFTLVPENFFSADNAREMLSSVVTLDPSDSIECCPVEEFGAVAVYSNNIGESLSRVVSQIVLQVDGSSVAPVPELVCQLRSLSSIENYNKIVASHADGHLYLTIAQGRTLLLSSAYQAPDFTTALYYVFLAMKRFQLNPEVSDIIFRTPLSEAEESTLYDYFRSVDTK